MDVSGAALVTGASRGMGRAVARELALRGFEVVATMRDPAAGRSLEAEVRQAGGRLHLTRLDVTDIANFEIPSGLRVLVNNAGVEAPHLPVEHTPLSVWRSVFETNLFGLTELTRLALPELRKSGGGVVCNITSAALLVPMPFFAVYRASKAAVGALGESLRAEVAPMGIRVVEILPGAVGTDMLEESLRPPKALEYELYRELASRVHAVHGAIEEFTPSETAARAIADAILDDQGPLRYGCDPMGSGLLEAWRSNDDETWMVGSGILNLLGDRE